MAACTYGNECLMSSSRINLWKPPLWNSAPLSKTGSTDAFCDLFRNALQMSGWLAWNSLQTRSISLSWTRHSLFCISPQLPRPLIELCLPWQTPPRFQSYAWLGGPRFCGWRHRWQLPSKRIHHWNFSYHFYPSSLLLQRLTVTSYETLL